MDWSQKLAAALSRPRGFDWDATKRLADFQTMADGAPVGAVGAPGGLAPYSDPADPFSAQDALAALSFAPVFGDVAGLAGDAAMYATDPSSRTPGNYAMSAAGALPFVPSAKAAMLAKALAANVGALGGVAGMAGRAVDSLPMGNAASNKGALEAVRRAVESISTHANENGPVYLRWSPSADIDLIPGRQSRDFVSGELHPGISAVEINSGEHPADIAQKLQSYMFLRMQNKDSIPRLYSGERVGTDSDGHASIVAKKLLEAFGQDVVASIDAGAADAMDLLEKAGRYRSKVNAGYPMWQEKLDDALKKLGELGYSEE